MGVIDGAYRLSIEPFSQLLEVKIAERVLASTSHALIMRETRLPPAIYYPPHDVDKTVLIPSERRTFCPFKGTASYWHIDTGHERIENGVWSYGNALEGAKDVQGYLAFMPHSCLQTSGLDKLPATASDGHVQGPLVDWLTRAAWLCPDPMSLTQQLGERMVAHGIAVSRISIFIWALHPEIAGRNYIWSRATGEVEVLEASYQNISKRGYQNSPIKFVADGLGGVRQPLNKGPVAHDFPIVDDLIAQGATDYVAMPLPFSSGRTNVLTLTSDHPDGFTTANLGQVFECAMIVGRFFEVFALRENTSAILDTYVGAGTGQRVLEGEIRRGDGKDMEAAILVADLRHSTRLAATMSRHEFLDLLNLFFSCVAQGVEENNGEILKFIGDAVLAVFPVQSTRAEACKLALNAANSACAAMTKTGNRTDEIQVETSIGLNVGEVTYGNVGSNRRLDFTVIGGPAIIAFRLSDLGKKIGSTISAAKDLACEIPEAFELAGAYELRNVPEPVEVYTPLT